MRAFTAARRERGVAHKIELSVADLADVIDAEAAADYRLVVQRPGYACARRLRENPPPGKPPVVIGVTAEAPESALRRCLEAGMDGYLTKPLDPKQLTRELARVAGRL